MAGLSGFKGFTDCAGYRCGGCANLPLATEIAISFHITFIFKVCQNSLLVIITHKEEALC